MLIPTMYVTFGLCTIYVLCKCTSCARFEFYTEYEHTPSYTPFWKQGDKCSHLGQILKKNIFILYDSHFCFWSIFSVLFRPIQGVNLKLDPSSFHQSSTFITLEFQGPYGPLKNSSPCGGLARFAHKGLGSFRISGNKKQRCD